MPRNFKVVSRVVFGRGCFAQLDEILAEQRPDDEAWITFLVDDVHRGKPLQERIPVRPQDRLIWVSVSDEPKTSQVDALRDEAKGHADRLPSGVIGIGGGSTMDLAKAVALMLTNPGSSAEYQGWDLIKEPAMFHAGVPTLAGTGAEVSRTTVLTGPEKKLGLNSDHTTFDQVVLDPEPLRVGVPKDQRFYTGMDCWIHCVEALTGTYLNTFAQAYGEKAKALCEEVFLEEPDDAADKLIMASYQGGISIAYSQVGVCHALSYGLGYELGLHHGIGNCIVFDQLDEYYGDDLRTFRRMRDRQRIELPKNVTADVDDAGMERMTKVALFLEPLWENALGESWRDQVTPEKIRELYRRM